MPFSIKMKKPTVNIFFVVVVVIAFSISLVFGADNNNNNDDDNNVYTDDFSSNNTLSGENVCIDQTPVNKTINVTYLESHDVKEYTWCLKIPPRCPVWKTKMVTRYKAKNVTRIVNKQICCSGYAVDATTTKRCLPVCAENRCLHGTCVEPEVCSCQPGFSGVDCGDVGCPGGNWGPDCSRECPCRNGGRCEPNTGVCQCLPGWVGLHCQNRCEDGKYGQDCSDTCACRVGHRCHHVTGDCSPCAPGSYGEKCRLNCTCSTSGGTALCYHEDGSCFCKPNYFGRSCELHCPFGYLDGVCHTSPMKSGFCSCASDLYQCDNVTGCVCRDGMDCESGGTRFIELAPLTAAEGGEGYGQAAILSPVIATVLVVALALALLFAVYYRRRMRRMQKDLEHRSVRYIENSVNGHHRELKKNELLVIGNTDPLGESHHVVEQQNNVNNAVASGSNNNNSNAGVVVGQKNVNIDRFKLGEENNRRVQDDDEEEAVDGAVGGFKDVNLYQEETSPSKEKNNERLADLYRKKASKASVEDELAVEKKRNNNRAKEEEEGEEEEEDDDDGFSDLARRKK